MDQLTGSRHSDSDSASFICDSCYEPICYCGHHPVENLFGWCDTGCDDYDYGYYDDGSEARDHHELQEQVRYAAGLIVKLGGGTYRQVFAGLHRAMQAKLGDASTDQLHTGLSHARDWARRLRNKVDPTPR